MAEIAGIADRLIVHAHDDITSAESGLLRPAAFLHRADKNSLSNLHPEEIPELWSDVLDQQAAAQGGMRHHNRNRHVELWNLWHGRHFKFEVLCFWSPGHRLFPIGELYLERKWLAVAAHAQRNNAPWGGLANHSPELRAALHVCTIHAEDHIVLFQSGLARGRVLVDHRHFNAALVLEFEGRESLGSDIRDVDAHVCACALLVGGKARVGH